MADDPDAARAAFVSAGLVTIGVGNYADLAGLFLNRYPRSDVVNSARIEWTIWAAPIGKLCQNSVPNTSADCASFNELARNPPALDENGFVVVRQEVKGPRPIGSPRNTTYIMPLSERASATGEAIYFQCNDTFESCRNTNSNFGGTAIRERVSLYYEFQRKHYPPDQMRNLDRRMRELSDNIILNSR